MTHTRGSRPGKGGSKTSEGDRRPADSSTVVSPGLAEVVEYRRAARMVLRDDSLSHADRAAALLRLLELAKASVDPRFTAAALVAEIGWHHDRDGVRDRGRFAEPLERAHRKLRNRGYEACPTCRSTLSTEVDWSIWRQMRRAAIAELEAREAAV